MPRIKSVKKKLSGATKRIIKKTIENDRKVTEESKNTISRKVAMNGNQTTFPMA